MDLKGKTVLITGTNGGMGEAIVREIASRGANVIAHARVPADEHTDKMHAIEKEYAVEIKPVYFDMTDTQAMKNTIRELLQQKTVFHALINNAGIAHGGLFQMTPVADIRKIFEINLFSHMELTQLVLKSMVRQKSGAIVNVASTSGIFIRSGNSGYGVSKAAMIAWTKTLAYELGPQGIRVNAVAPGLTNTRMARLTAHTTVEEMMEKNVMGRLAEPSEIAKTIAFLLSDDASYINGEIITVDGGGIKVRLDGGYN